MRYGHDDEPGGERPTAVCPPGGTDRTSTPPCATREPRRAHHPKAARPKPRPQSRPERSGSTTRPSPTNASLSVAILPSCRRDPHPPPTPTGPWRKRPSVATSERNTAKQSPRPPRWPASCRAAPGVPFVPSRILLRGKHQGWLLKIFSAGSKIFQDPPLSLFPLRKVRHVRRGRKENGPRDSSVASCFCARLPFFRWVSY